MAQHRKSSKVSSITTYSGIIRDENSSNDSMGREDCGLGKFLLDRLAQARDKIHHADTTVNMVESNGAVMNKAIQIALEMKSKGIKENDLVLICSRSRKDHVIIVVAALCIGAILVPLDPELSSEDLKDYVLSVKPKMAFCDIRQSGMLESIYRLRSDLVPCTIVVFGDYSDRLTFDKLLSKKPDPNFKPVHIFNTKTSVAFVVPSQSTTDGDKSKLVCISHRAILIQITVFAERLLSGTTKIISFSPLSWIPQIVATCYCISSPAIHIIPGAFNEHNAFRLIHELKIDTAIMSTEFAQQMIHHDSINDFNITCLQRLVVGGSVTTALDMVNLRTAFPSAKVHQCYGITEMTCLVSGFIGDDYTNAVERPGSVGKLLPYLKAKVVDLDSREILDYNMWGELLVRGPTMMLGYFKDPKLTEASMERSYFKTGDVVQYDSDGYLYVRGRISDHILVQGRRMHPKDIEEMILMHSHVRDVVVVGDDRHLVACVIRRSNSKLTASQLDGYLQDLLPKNKRPTKIKFMEYFPRTSVGKIKRKAMISDALGVKIIHSKSVISVE